ncbi:MAG TPA: glutamate--tRNA ligase, partial [Clostridia bacterium]
LTPEEFHEKAKPYYEGVINKKEIDTKKVSRILQVRTEILSEIPGKIDFIDNLPDYDINMYVHKKMKTTLENSKESLKAAYELLKGLDDWNEQSIHDSLMELVVKLGIKNGQMLWPIRTALTGKDVTPGGAIEIADILGKEECLIRIQKGIDKL